MICIGTSGWSYPHWQGIFYPEELRYSGYLDYYCRHFNTVEINSTFYHLPQPKTVQNWAEKTPNHFSFSVKGSRYITHRLKLQDCQEAVTNFIQRISPLQKKVAAILWQIPPSLHRDDLRLQDFFRTLPSQYRHVLEMRHTSWLEEEVFHLCRKANVAFCSISMPDFPQVALATADFAYVRMHGSTSLYSSDYSEEELQQWGDKICQLTAKADPIFVYFNNDFGGFAIKNALRLRELLREHGQRAD